MKSSGLALRLIYRLQRPPRKACSNPLGHCYISPIGSTVAEESISPQVAFPPTFTGTTGSVAYPCITVFPHVDLPAGSVRCCDVAYFPLGPLNSLRWSAPIDPSWTLPATDRRNVAVDDPVYRGRSTPCSTPAWKYSRALLVHLRSTTFFSRLWSIVS